MNIHEIFVQITGKGDSAKNELDEVAARMVAFGQQSAEAKLTVEATAANRELDEFIAKMALISASHPEATVRLNAQAAILQALLLKKAIGDFDKEVTQTTNRTARFRNALRDLGETLKPDSVRLGAFSFSLSRAGISLLFLAGTIVKSVIGALAALAASLTQAIIALGALGTAALAALGPLTALGIGAVLRFNQAKDAAEELKAATDALRSAEQAEADAQRGVDAALRAQTQAQQGLARARRDATREARDQMQAALDQVAAAEQAVADAQANALTAQVALSDAREEAIRQLQDLKFAAQDAAVSEEQAALALERARNQLREMERNRHTPNIALREQRLAVEDAENRLQEARSNNQRAQDDLTESERKGIAGSDLMVAARERLADANRSVVESLDQLSDASREFARLEREQARRSESIVAARHALQDANRQVAESQRRLRDATREVAEAQRSVNQLQQKAKAFGPGTAARDLFNAARDFRRAFQQITALGSDRIFRGITEGLNELRPMLQRLKDEFNDLGTVVGNAFRRLGREFGSPRWTKLFEFFTKLSGRLVGPATRAFIQFARAMGNIAKAASPFLVAFLKAVADQMGNLAGKTSDTEGLRLAIGTMVDDLLVWLKLIGQIGRFWLAFAKAAAPAGRDFAEWLGDAAGDMADFLSSAEGQDAIKDFFEDTIPLVKQVIGLVGEMFIAFVQFSALVAPLLAPVIAVLRTMFHLLNRILRLLQKLPEPLQLVLAGFALWLGPLRLVRLAFRGIKLLLGAILLGRWGPLIGAFAKLWGRLRGALDKVVGAFRTAWRFLATRLGPIVSRFAKFLLPLFRGAFVRIGAYLLRFVAVGGPIGLLIAALIEVALHWNEVKAAIGDAVDKLKSWVNVQKMITKEADKAFDATQNLAEAMGAGVAPAGAHGPVGPGANLDRAAGEAGKRAMAAFGEGLKRASQDIQPGGSGKIATALADGLRRNLRGGSQKGGGTTMNNTFITSGNKHADDREAVAAISRRLRQRGLSIA